LPTDDLNFVIHPYDGGIYAAGSSPDITGEWTWEMDENPTDNYIIMQYTGLKDKNGKEIYEGDILHLKCTKRNWPDEPSVFYRNEYVEWFQSFGFVGWRLRNKSLHMEIKPSALSNMEAEIIGNIYEHSELLEVQP